MRTKVTQAVRRQRRKRDKMSRFGFKRFEAWIHHDDEDAVREFVRSLNEPRMRVIAANERTQPALTAAAASSTGAGHDQKNTAERDHRQDFGAVPPRRRRRAVR